jgi:hypothetical protein
MMELYIWRALQDKTSFLHKLIAVTVCGMLDSSGLVRTKYLSVLNFDAY